jgi:hypothetical protein
MKHYADPRYRHLITSGWKWKSKNLKHATFGPTNLLFTKQRVRQLSNINARQLVKK